MTTDKSTYKLDSIRVSGGFLDVMSFDFSENMNCIIGARGAGKTSLFRVLGGAAEPAAGKVVRKDLVRQVKVGANVPTYVLEYLLGKYCATDDPAAVEAGLRMVNNTLADSIIRPDEAMKAQSRVKERGQQRYIDKVLVRLDGIKYWAEIVNFGHAFVHIPDTFVRQYERLLEGGVWAQVDIEFRGEEEVGGKVRPFFITDLKPIQVVDQPGKLCLMSDHVPVWAHAKVIGDRVINQFYSTQRIGSVDATHTLPWQVQKG